MSKPDSVTDRVLGSLAPQGVFRWVRGDSPRIREHGFEGVADIQHRVRQPDRPADALPEDLFETYRACRNRLSGGPGATQVHEVWNEPDFYFVQDSAADMAATLKAAYRGIKAANPDATVLMPSLAFRPGRYALELAANGLASWTEGWNVHFYGWAADYPGFLDHHRAFMGFIGCDLPIWVTEIGFMGLSPARKDDPAALSLQTAFHERTLIESWVADVDRHLVFLLTPYIEARNDLGLTASDGEWRPALHAAVRVVRALEGCRPLFRIRHRPTDDWIGVVLQRPDDRWWTVLWSPARAGEAELPGIRKARSLGRVSELSLPVRWPRSWIEVLLGIDGGTALAPGQVASLAVSESANLHVIGPPERFDLGDCQWIPLSEAGRSSKIRTGTLARLEADKLPPQRPPSPVVLRIRPEHPFRADKPSQTLRLPCNGTEAEVVLQFHNFSEATHSGSWDLDVPPGWSVLGPAPSLPSEGGSWTARHGIEVRPGARAEVRLRVRPRDEPGGLRGIPSRFRARWIGADGSIDEASVRWVAELPYGSFRPWKEWNWREFVASPDGIEAWQIFDQGNGMSSLEVRAPHGPNRGIEVHFRIPRGVRENDRFSIRARKAGGRGTPYLQLQLATTTGETWRHAELSGLGPEWAEFAAELGDFSPAIWSRHRTFLFPKAEDARWISLLLQGMETGDVIEVQRPAILRSGGIEARSSRP